MPRPILILDRIDNSYDGEPPSEGFFEIVISNTGDAAATDVIMNFEVYTNGDTLSTNLTRKSLILPGETLSKTSTLKGPILQQILDGKIVLEMHINLSYHGEHGGQFNNSFELFFDPSTDSSAFSDVWHFIVEDQL
jgi:hypothetical protein